MGERWVDLAGNVAGRQVGREATRRRRAEGAGADRTWRIGAEGEYLVAEALAELLAVSWWERLRGVRPGWWVLHSVPVGVGSSDIDHVVCGPPGLFTVNTKHHRTRRVVIEDDRVLVDRRETAYVAKAVIEAAGAARRLREALTEQAEGTGIADRLVVRPVLAIVGARLLGTGRPGGVIVATPAQLPMYLRSLPVHYLRPADVDALFEISRRSTTWARP